MGVEQWAWCHFGRWALIYSYSGLVLCATILSDDEDIKRESNRKLPDSTNLQRMEIPMERTYQKKTLITLAIGSCSHYPHGSSLPPCNYYRWVITTPMGHLMRILLHLFIFVYLCLLLNTFQPSHLKQRGLKVVCKLKFGKLLDNKKDFRLKNIFGAEPRALKVKWVANFGISKS